MIPTTPAASRAGGPRGAQSARLTVLRPVAAVLVAALVAAPVNGCSADTDDADPAAPSPTAAASPTDGVDEMLNTKATIRRVSGGQLPQEARGTLRERVTAVVDAWFEAAYLGGDYPRTDFDDAFGAFIPAARPRAVEDRKLLSNQAVGTTTYDVRALARRIVIDVLADRGRASAVTVQFRLGLARAGESGAVRNERVSGHLYLHHTQGDGWQIFGYDVKRGQI